MRPSLVSSSLVLVTSFALTGNALEVLANSPCAVQCGNVQGGTSGNDIVCPDSSYNPSNLAGSTFQTCITCQLGSTYVDPVTKETDVQWALYNLRYAISWCLFGFPNNTAVGDTPCITSTACGPLQNAIQFDSLSPNVSTFGYCPLLSTVSLPKCSACLSQQSNEYFLTNFLTTLQGGCQQQPTPGNTISLQGSLFSKTATNITSPSAAPTGVNYSKGSLTLGAKIGIAIGALVVLLITTGCCIVWNGKRRRRATLRRRQRESGFDDWRQQHAFTPEGALGINPAIGGATPPMRSAGGFYDSPDSQRPLHPWGAPVGRAEEESPASAFGEKVYFSPYHSQYSSPVSAHDQITIAREWPIDRKGSIGGSGPTAAESRSRSREKIEKDAGSFEMQNVTPVLLHPGNGRGGSLGLTEEDARRGAAL